VGIKLGVVVFDMSDLEKTGKSNSFIRLWLRCAAQSNSQQFSYFRRTTVKNKKQDE
jgi:hypothetical protein